MKSSTKKGTKATGVGINSENGWEGHGKGFGDRARHVKTHIDHVNVYKNRNKIVKH